MSPTDPPQNPPLTRRRIREMRTQGIPIILPGTTAPGTAAPAAEEPAVEAVVVETAPTEPASDDAPEEIVLEAVVEGDESAEDESAEEASDEDDESPRVIAADLGADLLAGEAASVAAPPSFDHLLTRSGPTDGSVATPNALILSQTPITGPLVVPVQGSGDVIITGSYELPESFGSTGTAPGTTDDKSTDATILDEELPLHSSPIPVSASAAVSTMKSGEELVAPPAPEKTNRIMMILAITAGVLALGLTGVLILSFATGVFR